MATISPYTGDGVTRQFDLTFSYRSADSIGVRVAGVDVSFTFVTSSRVETTAAPPAGSLVEIYRATPVEDPTAVFQDGQILRGADLNGAVGQVLNRAEELGSEMDALRSASVRVIPGETPIILPPANDRAGRVLGFGPTGVPYAASLGEGEGDGLREDLTSSDPSKGAALIGIKQHGPDAGIGDVATELRYFVRPEQFGAVGDGIADDTAAILKAAGIVSGLGGTILLNGKYFIGSDLVLPAGVNLVGNYRCPRGRPSLGSSSAPDYSQMGSSLRIASTATVSVSGSGGVSGLVAYRQGMIFPATPAASAAGYAGTAFTASGDDPAFENCLIMGFKYGIVTDGVGRVRINNCNLDNINDVDITDCDDRCYISNCHAWPFGTICAGQSWQNLIRTGTGFNLHDFLDWGSLFNCFTYGKQTGYRLHDVDSTTLILCGADNAFDQVALHENSVGIEVSGACYDSKLLACQTAAQWSAGVNINLDDGYVAHVHQHSSWGITSTSGPGHGILVQSGGATITGGSVRGSRYGVSVSVATSKVFVDYMSFANIGVQPISAAQITGNVKVGRNNDYGDFLGNPVSANIVAVTIATSDPLLLRNSVDEYVVSGATSFGSLRHGWMGREVMLFFTSPLTVYSSSGSTSSIRLAGGANFTASAGSILYLRHNGVQWFEVARA